MFVKLLPTSCLPLDWQTAPLGQQRPLRSLALQWPLSRGDLNRSMQHLDSEYREEDVADEVQIEDLLQRRAEKLDVGSLAGRRFTA